MRTEIFIQCIAITPFVHVSVVVVPLPEYLFVLRRPILSSTQSPHGAQTY